MTGIKDKLKRLKRRTATVEVCLAGDLAGEYEELDKQLADRPKSDRLGGDPERARILAEMERLRADMAEATIAFKLHALSDNAFQRLADEHPPRVEGDQLNMLDARWGYNRATFWPALIRASTVEPELDDDDWDLLLGDDGMSAGQKVALREAAIDVNGRTVDVPFSPAASKPTPGSDS